MHPSLLLSPQQVAFSTLASHFHFILVSKLCEALWNSSIDYLALLTNCEGWIRSPPKTTVFLQSQSLLVVVGTSSNSSSSILSISFPKRQRKSFTSLEHLCIFLLHSTHTFVDSEQLHIIWPMVSISNSHIGQRDDYPFLKNTFFGW